MSISRDKNLPISAEEYFAAKTEPGKVVLHQRDTSQDKGRTHEKNSWPLFLTFPNEKTTFQWSKLVSDDIFPTKGRGQKKNFQEKVLNYWWVGVKGPKLVKM